MAAPVTIVITNDLKFYDKLPLAVSALPRHARYVCEQPTADPGNCAAELYLARSLHDTCGAGSGTGLRADVRF